MIRALYAWKGAKYVERIEFLNHIKRATGKSAAITTEAIRDVRSASAYDRSLELEEHVVADVPCGVGGKHQDERCVERERDLLPLEKDVGGNDERNQPQEN